MAQLYTTGPAHIFVGGGFLSPGSMGTGGGNTPPQTSSNTPVILYLVTCEEAPEIVIEPKYSGTKNDLGGSEIPFDMQYEGEQGLISLDLNRYNEPVYAALASRPRFGGVRGLNGGADVGTLMQTEGLSLVTWVLFS